MFYIHSAMNVDEPRLFQDPRTRVRALLLCLCPAGFLLLLNTLRESPRLVACPFVTRDVEPCDKHYVSLSLGLDEHHIIGDVPLLSALTIANAPDAPKLVVFGFMNGFFSSVKRTVQIVSVDTTATGALARVIFDEFIGPLHEGIFQQPPVIFSSPPSLAQIAKSRESRSSSKDFFNLAPFEHLKLSLSTLDLLRDKRAPPASLFLQQLKKAIETIMKKVLREPNSESGDYNQDDDSQSSYSSSHSKGIEEGPRRQPLEPLALLAARVNRLSLYLPPMGKRHQHLYVFVDPLSRHQAIAEVIPDSVHADEVPAMALRSATASLSKGSSLASQPKAGASSSDRLDRKKKRSRDGRSSSESDEEPDDNQARHVAKTPEAQVGAASSEVARRLNKRAADIHLEPHERAIGSNGKVDAPDESGLMCLTPAVARKLASAAVAGQIKLADLLSASRS
ncbi:MAG: hypothetical protein SGPRY_005148 [Prymnesium sp.]